MAWASAIEDPIVVGASGGSRGLVPARNDPVAFVSEINYGAEVLIEEGGF
jgi:hypothetical protein